MTTRRYAAESDVSPARSRAEIEELLERHGCDQFGYARSATQWVISFRMRRRIIRLRLAIPTLEDGDVALTATGKLRSEERQEAALEQIRRQRWRALLLIIRAKLEAVEAGIADFSDEFLAGTVLPNGTTFGEWARPQLDAVYETAAMPALLPTGRPA